MFVVFFFSCTRFKWINTWKAIFFRRHVISPTFSRSLFSFCLAQAECNTRDGKTAVKEERKEKENADEEEDDDEDEDEDEEYDRYNKNLIKVDQQQLMLSRLQLSSTQADGWGTRSFFLLSSSCYPLRDKLETTPTYRPWTAQYTFYNLMRRIIDKFLFLFWKLYNIICEELRADREVTLKRCQNKKRICEKNTRRVVIANFPGVSLTTKLGKITERRTTLTRCNALRANKSLRYI